MTLYEGKKGNEYEITGIFVEQNITRRLEALGLNEGTKLKILTRKNHGAMIIHVRGTRLAIGKHITEKIEVKDEEKTINE